MEPIQWTATNVFEQNLQVDGFISCANGISGNTMAANGANFLVANTTDLTVTSNAQIQSLGVVGLFAPTVDNAISCGLSILRFTTVYAVSGVVNPSDPRLKAHMRPVPECLSIIRAVQPITWSWAKPEWVDGLTHWGFDAFELDNAVTAGGTPWAGLHMADDGSANLAPHEIIPILWQAVRELSAKVEALR